MFPSRPQHTIAQSAVVEGFGYWSGQDVRVEFHPADVDTGVVFVRSDLPGRPRIPAHVAHRVESPRRTTLRAEGAGVEMVEHLLAALAGVQVDNCEIRVNAAEMPGCDGSSAAFVTALDRAGRVSQDAPRNQLVIRESTRLGDDEAWIEVHPLPTAEFKVKYRLDYGRDNAIGRQTLAMRITPQTFRRELAPSRTFLLQAEADWLRQQGLGLRTSAQDLLIFGPEGPLDNPLRFPDECVRHKVLDLVGDLALTGCDIFGHVVAHRSGHRLNAELARTILTEGEKIGQFRRTA